MARIRVPYARAGKQHLLAAALTTFCVAVAASVALPALAAQPSGNHAPAGPQVPIAVARQRVRDVEQQLISVQDAASANASDYAAADAQVRLLETAIRVNSAQLVLTRSEISASRAALARRVLTLYADPPPSLIEVLVSSGSITSALDSYDVMRHIANDDTRLVTGFLQDRTRLASLATSLHTDAKSAIQNRAEVAARLGSLRSLAGQRSALLASATSVLVASEASAAQLAALRAEEARAAAAARPQSTPRQIIGATPSSGGHTSPSPTSSSGSGSTTGAGSSTGSGSGSSSGSGSGSVSGGMWAILHKIAMCESGGNPRAISPNGQYRGMFQFTYATWASVGGSGDPAQASAAEQMRRAAILYERDGPGQWPVCGA
jgi:peptidoglycan hydrolase CwlO-like protein